VVDAIRQANPRVVTLILTGYPDFESAVAGIHHSVDDYLTKPAEVDLLVSVMEKRLAEKRLKSRILSVSYDEPLLRTRHMLLQREGYQVVSSLGFDNSLEYCKNGGFDIFVLGHSIPHEEKRKLVASFRTQCPGPIISLRRSYGEQPVDGADYQIEPDPEPLLKLISELVSSKENDS
jgi:DNA-binding response OmpR family regulator